jgi:hypothetical protein
MLALKYTPLPSAAQVRFPMPPPISPARRRGPDPSMFMT